MGDAHVDVGPLVPQTMPADVPGQPAAGSATADAPANAAVTEAGSGAAAVYLRWSRCRDLRTS